MTLLCACSAKISTPNSEHIAREAELQTYCSPSAVAERLPASSAWQKSKDARVEVTLTQPCWVRITPPAGESAEHAPLSLVLDQTQGLDIRQFDAAGNMLARSTRGLPLEHAAFAGQYAIFEADAKAGVPVHLYIALAPKATQRSQTETRLRWEPLHAVLPQALFGMSVSLAAVGALAFLIFLSCVLALALRRPLFALAGCASLCNVQYLLSATGGYSALGLPTFLLAAQGPLGLANFGMLLLFFVRFCELRQQSPRAALALLTLTGLSFGCALLLLVVPSSSLGYDIYEWLRPPAYGLLLYTLARGAWSRHVSAMLCLIALVPDFVYMVYYLLPLMHWALGDTVLVEVPQFMGMGSLGELFTILWMPFVLCLALVYRVLNIERERANAALSDALTGLPNRLGLRRKVARLQTPYLCVVLELNRFKSIDLALGRALGDRVLQGFAERLRTVPGTVVARFHADRFALLIQGNQSLGWVTAQIDGLLSHPLQVDNQIVDLSATLGLARCLRQRDIELDLSKAEIALHQARQRHAPALEYSAELEQPRRSDLSLMSDLHQAVARKELRMYLQPKVNMLDGSVMAAEGLVRWQHPVRGLVLPAEFVKFAELTGRIGVITRWMLERAMEVTAAHRAHGRPLQISVNVSVVDLGDPGFVKLMDRLIEQTGAMPVDIKLEITESAAMEHPELALGTMRQLRDRGFEWALDDFGTGYSSLSYLQRMPLSELKVDRAFVHRVSPGSEHAKLLGSIISLGHQLGLLVVAEGAETAAEWELLRTLGVDAAQGWYAAKAMPLLEFVAWWDEHPNFGV